MRKKASTLAKEYEFNTKEEYFNYIVETLINGQRQQVRDLFNAMRREDQNEFLIDYLDIENQGYHKSVLNICITEI
tara:strand:- start:3031 stop:3258 length:228 start_codon:yes stop_codon:yes gene_type:complete